MNVYLESQYMYTDKSRDMWNQLLQPPDINYNSVKSLTQLTTFDNVEFVIVFMLKKP